MSIAPISHRLAFRWTLTIFLDHWLSLASFSSEGHNRKKGWPSPVVLVGHWRLCTCRYPCPHKSALPDPRPSLGRTRSPLAHRGISPTSSLGCVYKLAVGTEFLLVPKYRTVETTVSHSSYNSLKLGVVCIISLCFHRNRKCIMPSVARPLPSLCWLKEDVRPNVSMGF